MFSLVPLSARAGAGRSCIPTHDARDEARFVQASPLRGFDRDSPVRGTNRLGGACAWGWRSLVARAAGRLSRLAGRGRRHDPARQDPGNARPGALRPARRPAPARIGARLGHEREDDDGRDGRGDPRPARRLAHNRAGANLVSGVASALLAHATPSSGLFEVDEAAFPEVARRVAPAGGLLGNLFRDQLDRYGELELVAERWRAARRGARPDDALVVNGDDPLLGGPRARAARPRVALRARRPARRARPPPPRRRLEVLRPSAARPTSTPRPTWATSATTRCPTCGHARPPLDVVAREIELDGLEGVVFDLVTPAGHARASTWLSRPLQRLQRARRRVARARRWARRSTTSRPGWSASARRSGASSGSRWATGPSSSC